MRDNTGNCGHPEEGVIKFAPRRMRKALWRKRHLRRVLQDEEELARIIETFDVLSKVRTRSGKAVGWTLSNPPLSPRITGSPPFF